MVIKLLWKTVQLIITPLKTKATKATFWRVYFKVRIYESMLLDWFALLSARHYYQSIKCHIRIYYDIYPILISFWAQGYRRYPLLSWLFTDRAPFYIGRLDFISMFILSCLLITCVICINICRPFPNSMYYLDSISGITWSPQRPCFQMYCTFGISPKLLHSQTHLYKINLMPT